MPFWAIITRSPNDPTPGRWGLSSMCFDTKAAAAEIAHKQCDGTGVEWRLLTIPGDGGV